MDYLLEHTKLNKDIIKITCKYIDYSQNNIMKLIPEKRICRKLQIKLGLSLFDIILKCLKIGYKGFYISTKNNCMSQMGNLELLIDKLYLNNNKGIYRIVYNKSTYFTLDFISHIEKYYYCDILSLIELFEYNYTELEHY
jgi:hypothetical protein